MKYTHDAIVIGAGAAGLTAAGGIAMFGGRPALIEAGAMGGECLNTGCVPSKALLAAAARAQEAGGARLGVTLPPPQVSYAEVHAHIHTAIAVIAPHDSQDRFEGLGAEVIRERAALLGGGRVRVGAREISAPRIVIATGSAPFIPPITGIEGVNVLTNENIWQLTQLPGHLVIVGAGNMGMEMAQAFRRLGSEVTVISRSRPLPRDDEEAALLVQAILEREGVRFITGIAQSVGEYHGGITLTIDSGEKLVATHLLVAAGRRANVEGLGLEAAGVEIGDNGIIVDARRRTTNARIYAIGDCRDGPRLTHVAGYEGSNVAAEIALGLPSKVRWTSLPWCSYTDPELAQVGLTEAEARLKHRDKVQVVRERFDQNDRAVAEGRTEGFFKLVLKGRKVLGVTIVGHGAGEMLLPWSQVISGKASSFALGSAVIAYPTRNELSKAVSFAAWEPLVFGRAAKGWSAIVRKLRRMR